MVGTEKGKQTKIKPNIPNSRSGAKKKEATFSPKAIASVQQQNNMPMLANKSSMLSNKFNFAEE